MRNVGLRNAYVASLKKVKCGIYTSTLNIIHHKYWVQCHINPIRESVYMLINQLWLRRTNTGMNEILFIILW